MFTRTNIAIALMLFMIFFVTLSSLWGEHGYLVKREMEKQREELVLAVEKKRAELELLRGIDTRKDSAFEEEELMLSFPDESYIPEENNEEVAEVAFKGLSKPFIFSISSLPSILYLAICFFIRYKRRGKNG